MGKPIEVFDKEVVKTIPYIKFGGIERPFLQVWEILCEADDGSMEFSEGVCIQDEKLRDVLCPRLTCRA